MKKRDAIQHYGSQRALADALGISEQAVSQWPDDVPEPRNFQIEVLTHGKLRARIDPATAPEGAAA